MKNETVGFYEWTRKKGPEEFTKLKFKQIKPRGKAQFTKPIVVLTSDFTASAAEVFLLMIKDLPYMTIIGDTTAGDFSDVGMRRFLPNGWQYQYSIMMYLQADGHSLDGIGHIPDIFVRNSATDIQSGEDKVLERAITFLFDEYGIE